MISSAVRTVVKNVPLFIPRMNSLTKDNVQLKVGSFVYVITTYGRHKSGLKSKSKLVYRKSDHLMTGSSPNALESAKQTDLPVTTTFTQLHSLIDISII